MVVKLFNAGISEATRDARKFDAATCSSCSSTAVPVDFVRCLREFSGIGVIGARKLTCALFAVITLRTTLAKCARPTPVPEPVASGFRLDSVEAAVSEGAMLSEATDVEFGIPLALPVVGIAGLAGLIGTGDPSRSADEEALKVGEARLKVGSADALAGTALVSSPFSVSFPSAFLFLPAIAEPSFVATRFIPVPARVR